MVGVNKTIGITNFFGKPKMIGITINHSIVHVWHALEMPLASLTRIGITKIFGVPDTIGLTKIIGITKIFGIWLASLKVLASKIVGIPKMIGITNQSFNYVFQIMTHEYH